MSGTDSTQFTDDPSIDHLSAEEPAEWKPGDVILNLYEVKNILGEGGMGTVYRVRHRTWGTDLAVKSPKPALLKRSSGAERVERECETWINLGLHPYVVSCYYVRRIADIPRIFAEYVEGANLFDWMRKGTLYAGGHDKALERILQVGIQSAWGIQHAHNHNFVHRDLKPHNIMMTAEGNAKVTDFGLAQAMATSLDDGQGQRPQFFGMTPSFCSPEQFAKGELTTQSDLWSWALCMLQMFTLKIEWKIGIEAPEALRRCFDAGPPNKHVPPLPKALAGLLDRCFQNDPAARPESMNEVAETLKAIYQGVTGMAYPETTPKGVDAVADSLNNRAISFLDLGKRNEAVQCWNQALKDEPHHPNATYNLGLLQWRSGRIADDALVTKLDEVCQLNPDRMLPIFQLVQVHFERGDSESAIRILRSVQNAYPDREDIRVGLQRANAIAKVSRRLLASFDAHMDAITAVCLSADGRYALSASEDNTVKMWSLPGGECLRVFQGHQGSIESLDLSEDGTLVLSASQDRTMRIWDRTSGECVRKFDVSREAVRAACLARDGRFALSRDHATSLVLWDITACERKMTLAGHADSVHAVQFSPDGHRAVSAAQDGSLKLWDLASGDCLQTFLQHEGAATTVAIRQDGAYVLSGGEDRSLRLWEVASGRCVRQFNGHRAPVRKVAFCKDGIHAVSVGDDGTLRYWNAATGRCLRTFEGHRDNVVGVGVSDDAQLALTGSRDRTLKLWYLGEKDLPSTAPYMLCKAQRTELALSAEIDFKRAMQAAQQHMAEGKMRYAARELRKARALRGYGRRDDAVLQWSRLYTSLPRTALKGAWESAAVPGHEGAITGLAFSRDGRFLLSGGADGAVRLWAAETGKCLRNMTGHSASVKSVDLSADGRLAISGGEDQMVQVWDVEHGHLLHSFEGVAGSVETLKLSPDGRFALSGGWDLRLWDVSTGRHLWTFEGHTADVVSICWSWDGRRAVSGSSDESVRIWDIEEGDCLLILKGHTGIVRAVNVSGDSRTILSASSNMWGRPGRLRVWNMDTGENLRVMEGHESSVNTAALTFDGRYAFSGSGDQSFRIWDVDAAKCVRSFHGQTSAVTAVAASLDGRMVVTGEHNGKLQFWTLDWELDDRAKEEWDDGALPYVEAWLTVQTPYAAEIPEDCPAGDDEVLNGLARRGRPVWTEEDLNDLLYILGCAGYGYFSRDVLEDKVKALASKRGRFSFFGRKRR